jgi:hypothetical protein
MEGVETAGTRTAPAGIVEAGADKLGTREESIDKNLKIWRSLDLVTGNRTIQGEI